MASATSLAGSAALSVTNLPLPVRPARAPRQLRAQLVRHLQIVPFTPPLLRRTERLTPRLKNWLVYEVAVPLDCGSQF